MSSDLINPEVAKKGDAIAKALMEGGSAGWSTLIGKNVTYAFVGNDFGLPDEVIKPAEIPRAVITTVDWSGDTAGKIQLIVPASGAREVVAYMMALMLGGEPDPENTKLDAEGMDAYSEAVGNYFGPAAQQARSEIGGVIKTAVGASRLADFTQTHPNELIGTDDYYFSKIKVTIEGRPPFTLNLLIEQSVTGLADKKIRETSVNKAAMAKKLGVDPDNLAIAMKIAIPLIVNIAVKKMRMEAIQEICPGTIIEFKKASGENLDVMAGNVRVAMAEAVTINKCFGVQIRTLIDPHAKIKE
ncbi:MAG: FliM/FliN family flagellar motor switch protein [Planctomycetota bacterium]|jgi:flagellar motor switch/type III secretory pathway protein FliN|nr:FliM/FliN family flagellar motor switch protein [Planctomycetota bacterium]